MQLDDSHHNSYSKPIFVPRTFRAKSELIAKLTEHEKETFDAASVSQTTEMLSDTSIVDLLAGVSENSKPKLASRYLVFCFLFAKLEFRLSCNPTSVVFFFFNLACSSNFYCKLFLCCTYFLRCSEILLWFYKLCVDEIWF